MERAIVTGGQFHDTGNARQRWNRTGAATVVGSVGFVDYPQADADSGSVAAGMDNVVAVTTTRIGQLPKLVVAAEAGADNVKIKWFEGDDIVCYALVDSTTDILKGDWLIPVNAGDNLVKATRFSVDETGAAAAESLSPVYAQALEGRTADSKGLILVRLFSNGKIF